MTARGLEFRPATGADWPAIWSIFSAVVVTGDTYPYPPDIAESAARAAWLHDGTGRRVTYVAEADGELVATAYVKPNQVGLGDHVANAGWMVSSEVAGRGVGRAFAEYVLAQAQALGFAGMQFNAVVATNTRAIALWESLGFEIVGTVPDAFRHATEGLTSIHIMYRRL